MGKTKTAVVTGMPDETKSGKAAYEEKRKKRAEKQAQEEKRKKQVTKVGLKGGERIKVVETEMPVETAEEKGDTTKTKRDIKRKVKPKTRGKKYKLSASKVDKNKLYSFPDAVKLVKETSYAKFDGTLELHLTVKKEGLSTNVELPYPAGKKKKVEIANTDTLKKLKEGKVDFDVLLATADMMPKLIPFAKILGPKGLMPNPKAGTIIKDKSEASAKKSAQSVVLKTEKKAPLIHTPIGKVSQKDKQLTENIEAIINAVNKKQIEKAYLTSTMGPSVKLSLSS